MVAKFVWIKGGSHIRMEHFHMILNVNPYWQSFGQNPTIKSKIILGFTHGHMRWLTPLLFIGSTGTTIFQNPKK